MKLRKATRGQLKWHNRQLILRAIYDGIADNRAALSQETGLAKPTVSELVAELLQEGLLIEDGLGESTDSGGKRPTIIKFVPNARQVIGISVTADRIFGILSNLNGDISARHYANLNNATQQNAIDILKQVVNGLIAQLDAPLLCIGVGVTGVVDSANGIIHASQALGWFNIELANELHQHYQKPVYIGNNTELTAIAQFAFGKQAHDSTRNLMVLLVNDGVEIGVAWENATYHHGGDIGFLHPSVENAHPLNDSLSWNAIIQKCEALRAQYPNSILPTEGLSYLHIKYAMQHSDALAIALSDQIIQQVSHIVLWAIAFLHPSHVTLAGTIVDLGDTLMSSVISQVQQSLPQAQSVTFSMAHTTNMSALGAVALAIQKELDVI